MPTLAATYHSVLGRNQPYQQGLHFGLYIRGAVLVPANACHSTSEESVADVAG